jgi:hypothetical protein
VRTLQAETLTDARRERHSLLRRGAPVCSARSIGLVDGARDLNPRGDVELAEEITHVCLDRLRTEEQRFSDLRVRTTVYYEPRDLKFALRQRLDA